MANRPKDDPSNKGLALRLQLLHSIDQDIYLLEKRLKGLRAQRLQVEGQIAVIRASTAPINRIPIEILSYIFQYAIHPSLYERSSVMKSFNHRTTLSLVCKCWRNAITGDPMMWKHLLVTNPRGGCTNDQLKWFRQVEKYISASLSRSKEVALNVIIDLTWRKDGFRHIESRFNAEFRNLMGGYDIEDWVAECNMDHMVEAYDQPLEKLILMAVGEAGANMERWRSLHLLLPILGNSLENLWHLIDWSAPSLRYISIDNDQETPPPPSTSATFRMVQELCLEPYRFLNTVPKCPHLQSLSLFIEYEFDWDDLRSLVQFPLLTELILRVRDFDCGVLDKISLPDLKHLGIYGWFPMDVVEAFECKCLSKLSIGEALWEQCYECAQDDFVIDPQVFSIARYIVFGDSRKPDVEACCRSLSKLLPKLSSAHTIEVVPSLVKPLLRLVEVNRKNGCLSSLRTIIGRDEKSGLPDEVHYIAAVIC